MDKPKDTSIGIAMADHEKNAAWMMDVILTTLRCDNPDPYALRMIADLIDPASKKGKFKLVLKGRRGNKSQADDAFFERIDAFREILESVDWDETEAVKTAAMPIEDGGIGKSEATLYSYLRAIKAARGE